MSIRTNILLRAYLAFALIVLFAFAVLFKLYKLQFVEGKKWKAKADSLTTRYFNIEATRGNIYSIDGSLLATSVPEYELRMDMLAGGIEKDAVFYEHVDALANNLAQLFKNRSAKEYGRMFRKARYERNRYLLINRKVSYQDLKRVRTFPLFNLGKYKGGLLVIEKNKRILPFGILAARTIGYKRENVQPVGLEGAYGDYIDGVIGKRLMQRLAGGVWMPVNDDLEIAPREGSDIISTIDINIQDVAQNALERQLIKSNADFGCVVLMEVATGEIRAIANYTKVSEGIYKEQFNYAIAQSAEPGSTFKLASYLTAIDQGKFDLDDKVDVSGGKFQIYNHTIRDDHSAATPFITMKHAFEESSNVAIAKQIWRFYGKNPTEFTDKLSAMHLGEPLGLEIPGEGKPLIKTPQSKSWSGLTLPQMAYGYELKLTPLQMLVLYNAVANGGKMIAPIFVHEIRELGKPIQSFKARVVHSKICSDETLKKMRTLLEGVVQEGTAKAIQTSRYAIAGKTGTAQIAQGAGGYKGKRQYQASFCGYFPADIPKYSMIVLINNPTQGSYYAAQIAGPVFREIADRVYGQDLKMSEQQRRMKTDTSSHLIAQTPKSKKGDVSATAQVYQTLGWAMPHSTETQDSVDAVLFDETKINRGMVPNVLGMGLRDAVFLLGNAGFYPKVIGSGVVMKQSLPAGTQVGRRTQILIELR